MVAKNIAWKHSDLDHLIEADYFRETQNKLNCRQIFLKEGEIFFRHLETKTSQTLPELAKTVISLGGGTLMCEENCQAVKKAGKLIYLQEDPLTLWKRLSDRSLPPYLDQKNPQESFLILAARRHKIFMEQADTVVLLKKRPLKVIMKEFLDGI